MNLNNKLDFARLTMDRASGVLDLLTGAQGANWDIDEAAFGRNGVFAKFHIFETGTDFGAGLERIDERSGRRKARFEFPYKNGQATDDLGGKGRDFEVQVLIHGKGYKKAIKALLDFFDDPRPGDLIHPVFGSISCVPLDWEIGHSSELHEGATLRISFTTHDFDVSFADRDRDGTSTFKSAITAAVSFFAKINNVLNKVESNILAAAALKNAITAAIGGYNDQYTATLTKLNNTFNRDGSSTDIPALTSTNTGGIFPVAGSLNSVLQSIPDEAIAIEIATALATQQATDQVILLRKTLQTTIDTMSEGEGAVLFREEILELKRSAIAVQKTLELGIQSSQSQIIDYEVPRLMSLREVAYLNGLSLDRAYDLEILNPSLESTNYIEAGTVLKVLKGV